MTVYRTQISMLEYLFYAKLGNCLLVTSQGGATHMQEEWINIDLRSSCQLDNEGLDKKSMHWITQYQDSINLDILREYQLPYLKDLQHFI